MRSIGGSRDATWLPGHGERPRRWRRPAGGARITARPAAPRAAGGGHRGGPAGRRRADRRLVREVAAAARRRHRGAAPHGDHGHGRLPGPDLVGADARRGVPGDAVRRVRDAPRRPSARGVGLRAGGRPPAGRQPAARRCTSRSWTSPPATRSPTASSSPRSTAQPLFALTGTVPAWRDLTPGESGPDVTELQKALASLGYYDGGDTAGYFGAATEYAVSAVLRAPRLHPAVLGGRASGGRGVPAVAARDGGRGERRGRRAARPAVPRARRPRVAGADR